MIMGLKNSGTEKDLAHCNKEHRTGVIRETIPFGSKVIAKVNEQMDKAIPINPQLLLTGSINLDSTTYQNALRQTD